jgi:hypothetical protein
MHAFRAPSSPGSSALFRLAYTLEIHQGGELQAIVTSLMYLAVTFFTDGNLLAVQFS